MPVLSSRLVKCVVEKVNKALEELRLAGHKGGPQCVCSLCQKLKQLEDNFILKSGTFYNHGLNTRDQVKNKARCQW